MNKIANDYLESIGLLDEKTLVCNLGDSFVEMCVGRKTMHVQCRKCGARFDGKETEKGWEDFICAHFDGETSLCTLTTSENES